MPEQQKVDDITDSTLKINPNTSTDVEESLTQSNKDENTRLENSTYNILMAMGKELIFCILLSIPIYKMLKEMEENI
jgi:hypothetical protein